MLLSSPPWPGRQRRGLGETTSGAVAGTATQRLWLRHFLCRSCDVLRYQLCREHHLGVVFRCVLDLLEVVEPGILVDAVDAGDEPRRARRIGVEVLVDGAGWNVDHVTRFPFETLHLALWLPVIGVGDLDIAVLVQ